VISFRTARVAPEKAAFRPALPLRSSPGLNGTTMTKMTYGEQLKHPMWQRKRLHILNRDGWMCQKCCAEDKTLHVHHKVYIKGRMVWEYDDSDLQTLCDDCHERTHLDEQELKRLLAVSSHGTAVAVLRGFLTPCMGTGDAQALYDDDPVAFAGMVASTLSLLTLEDAMQVHELVQALFLADFDEAAKGSDI